MSASESHSTFHPSEAELEAFYNRDEIREYLDRKYKMIDEASIDTLRREMKKCAKEHIRIKHILKAFNEDLNNITKFANKSASSNPDSSCIIL